MGFEKKENFVLLRGVCNLNVLKNTEKLLTIT